MINQVSSQGLEWTNLVLGAGLACAAFMFTELPPAAWNAGIVGSLIVCCSAVALTRYADWTEWSNLMLGCWTAMAPLLLGFGSAQGPMWTHVVVGVAVSIIAAGQLFTSHSAQSSSCVKFGGY